MGRKRPTEEAGDAVIVQKEPIVFHVWPTSGPARKWSVQQFSSGIHGSFDVRDECSLSLDCLAADRALFDHSFLGWRVASSEEQSRICLEWDGELMAEFDV